MRRLLSPRRRAFVAAALLPLAARQARAQSPAPVRRIVSIGGAVTETLFALGAESEIVGVDTTSLHPAAARRLPSVGYARALSAEGVLSLRPTLVLASGDAGPPAVLRQLEAARLPVTRIESPHGPTELLAMVRRLGALTARAEGAERLARQLEGELAAARRRVTELTAGRTPPRVLFVLAHAMNQVRLSGHGTAAHAMIELAGARNAFAEVEGYKPLTPEAAVAAAPDILLITEQGLQAAGGVDGLLQAPGLAATPAGRARRVAALDALLLLGFGPRLPQALQQLAEALHAPAPRA